MLSLWDRVEKKKLVDWKFGEKMGRDGLDHRDLTCEFVLEIWAQIWSCQSNSRVTGAQKDDSGILK